jgi:hypothetical protein
MIVVGAYGAISSAKYFERWMRHWRRSAGYRAQLLRMYPDIEPTLQGFSYSREQSKSDLYEMEISDRFPVLSKIRLHRLWVGFHVGVVVLGVALSLVAISV